MSMNEAIHIVCTGTFVRILLPDWILKLTKQLDSIRIAFEELQVQTSYFIEQIDILNVTIHFCRCICLKWSMIGKIPT